MKRRKRSGRTTHKRAWHSAAKAPRGKPWAKVDTLLERLKAEHSFKAMALPVFQTLWTLQRDNGWKGNAVTQFVWEQYRRRTEYMPYVRDGLDMGDVLAAVDGQAFPNWLDAYAEKHGSGQRKYGESKGEIIPETKPTRFKVRGKPKPKVEAPKVETQAERWKRIGDERRAENATAEEQSGIRQKAWLRDRDIEDIWRLISKGEFPLGTVAFDAELKRRANEREQARQHAVLFDHGR